MRTKFDMALKLESDRMQGLSMESYPLLHERHRTFPEVFEDRKHRKIIDISSGIGVVAKRIIENYDCDMDCNEIEQNCLKELQKLKVNITSFDLDSGNPIPIKDNSYDAVICLATLEHLINSDFFIQELHRILKDEGRLYLSVPNYASLYWLIPILRGRTFHDPFDEKSRYEFYAHVRYFTYYTLLDYMKHFKFNVDSVYLPIPKGSNKFKEIRQKSKILAFFIQISFRTLYKISPRWHQEPVICFAKSNYKGKIRKVIL